MFLLVVSSPGVYHTGHPYVSTGFTTAVYMCLALLKVAPQVDLLRAVRDMSWAFPLACVFLIWGPHFSLVSTWTPRSLRSGTGPSSNPGICVIAVILYLLGFLVK